MLRGGALAILSAAFIVTTPLRAQEYDWAKRVAGSTDEDLAYSIAVDDAGNVLSTGFFRGTADFDPGPGTYNLTSGGNDDIFVSKLDRDGNLVWARRLGNYNSDQGFSIATRNGNIYVMGRFQDTVDFDPDPNVQYPLSCGLSDDTFLLKLDEHGTFIWAKCIGGMRGGVDTFDMVLDANGNMVLNGRFQGTVDFDLDPNAVYNVTSGAGSPMFIAKYNENGAFVWVKQMGTVFIEDVLGTAVDGVGNVYSTGYFAGTVDFDPGPGVFELSSPYKDATFVQKLDASGNFVWARQLGGGFDAPKAAEAIGTAIAVDGDGSVLTTGHFSGSADFDPDPDTNANFYLKSATSSDMFISRLDQNGHFVWAVRFGGPGAPNPSTIAIDVSHNIYTSGRFGGTLDFNPGPGTTTLTSRSTDVFVSKLDSKGNFVWATGLGGASEDGAFGFALDSRGGIYASGYFSLSADFVPGPGVSNITSAGDYDVFALKLGQTPAPTFSDRATMSWGSVFGETAYNVYRSDTVLPGSFSCLASHMTGPTITDSEVPASASLFGYLVTTITASGDEGTMGFAAVRGMPASERANSSPCP